MDDLIPNLFALLAAILIAGLLALLGYLTYDGLFGTKITLLKANWTCTATKHITIYVKSGNVLVPVITTSCTQYTERN